MTSDRQFRVQFWQLVDDNFRTFILKTKPNSPFHALRLQITVLSYAILGHRYFYIWARKNPKLRAFLDYFDLEVLHELSTWMGDDYSKQLLIKLMARKMLHDSVHLDHVIDNLKVKVAHEQAEGLVKKPETYSVSLGDHSWVLNFYDLSSIGYPLCAHLHRSNVACTFMFEQYRYKRNNIDIGVEKGDIAIDGGGCWGDTALYMAAKGAERVYSFEFSEENLKILDQNLAANPKLTEHITVVQKAIWNEDGVHLNFQTQGPATSLVKLDGGSDHVDTVTIDTFVEQMKIERVDFIKMDIEGAEMNALKGARKTIERFGPKLAITVYHKPEDLFTIPQLMKSIRPDYDLYLDHFTTGATETVLFAVPRGGRTAVSQPRISEAAAHVATNHAS